MRGKLIARVRDDFAEFIAGLEARRIALNMSMNELEERAGLGRGHYSHIVKWQARHGRNVSVQTLVAIVLTLGLELRIHAVEDIEPGTLVTSMARPRA